MVHKDNYFNMNRNRHKNKSNNPKPTTKTKSNNSPNSLGELVSIDVWQKMYNQTKNNDRTKNDEKSVPRKSETQ